MSIHSHNEAAYQFSLRYDKLFLKKTMFFNEKWQKSAKIDLLKNASKYPEALP